jgi:PelA/Pel-15E family pectate lyase
MNASAIKAGALPLVLPAAMLALLLAAAPGTPAAAEPLDVARAKAMAWSAISQTAFADSIHHARMKFVDQRAPYPQYAPEQIVHIAENLLIGQNDDGGWPKNKDWTRADNPASLRGGKSTLDNRTTWSQIDYLARVHQRTELKRYAHAAMRGIDYLLQQQRDSGGWRGADVDAITYNDDVMAGVMSTLQAIGQERERYGFVDPARLKRVATAYVRGLDCILRTQVRIDGQRTAWGQQHDHVTLAPVWARAYEPPALASAESVGVVRFLMSIDEPSPEIVASIEAAVAWLDRVKIPGLRIDEVPAEPVQFRWHYSETDRVAVRDPAAPPIWARFYDLETQQPIFGVRPRQIVHHLRDVSRERRTGYSWYGHWPSDLLNTEYPRWRKKHGLPEAFSDRPRRHPRRRCTFKRSQLNQ